MAEPLPDWWVDGQRGALLPPDDRGLLYGDGVFRTLLVWDGQADDLRGQLRHLQADCAAIGLEAPDPAQLSDEILSAAKHMDRGCLRITITRGSGGQAYDPRGAGPARRILQARGLPGCAGRPVTACLLDVPVVGLSGSKHLNRLHNVLAAAQVPASLDTAVLRGFDGQLLSGLQANLFLVDAAGQLLTPPMAPGVVAGRMRARVLDAAREGGVPVLEQIVDAKQLECAAEACLSNAVLGLHPLGRVDEAGGQTLWTAAQAPGPLTRQLMAAIPHPFHH